MKRIFAFTMAVLMVISMVALTGCNKEPSNNLYEDFKDFDSYVSEDSQIIGKWKETSTTDEMVATFFATTTLHLTKTINGLSYSTVCTFNFNDETKVLSYYVFTGEEEHTYNVAFEGDTMTWTSEDGAETRTFEKLPE